MNHPFASLSPCDYADALPRSQFADYSIRPLWAGMPRIAGPAFTVKCAPGDHLMFHAAIYEASPGDIIVAQADDTFALAGGNVCAIAKRRGIAGFVIDGTIRDLAEVREMAFPVYARGVIPKPGAKKEIAPLNEPILCAGAPVNPGDIVVADEEGVAFIPARMQDDAFQIAKARAEKDAGMSLDEWEQAHHGKVMSTLKKLGY